MTAFLYDLIFILPISLAGVLFGRSYFVPEDKAPYLYAVSIAVTVFCVLLYHLKTRGRILLTGITAAIAAGVLVVTKGELLAGQTWILWTILICIAAFVIGKVANKDIRIKAVLALLMMAYLVILMVTKTGQNKALAISLIFYPLIFVLCLIQTYWNKEGDREVKNHTVYLLPFIVIACLPAVMIKAPDKPYDWKFVKNLSKNIRTGYEVVIQTLFPENGWDGGDTMGFSDRAVIGGRVTGDAYPVLSVSSDVANDYRLYLSGKSFDTFDGRKWEKTDQSEIDYRSYDLLETLAAIDRFDEEHESDYVKNVLVTVSYEGIRTSHLFVPAKTVPEIASFQFEQKGADLIRKGSKKSDYMIRYYRINRDDPSFEEILKKGESLTKEDIDRTISLHSDIRKYSYSDEGYAAYRDRIRQVYAQPVELTGRCESLMDETLAGAESDFEKLERIEKLLSSFDYTRTPGDIPDNIQDDTDFLDYFLCEKKAGFCTHYATAFVLLARSQNIPARYVQGYSTLTTSIQFEITSDRTHAWPEAYIEGVGWIGFEPTPGYRQRAGWDKATGSVSADPDSVHSTYEGKHGGTDKDIEDTFEEDKGNRLPGFAGLKWIGTIALIVAIFLILFFISDRFVQIYRYDHMNDRDKILSLCRKNMRVLKRMGYGIGMGETLSEFSVRIRTDISGDLLEFVGLYEKMLYSLYDPAKSDVSQTEQENKALERTAISRFFGHIPVLNKIIKKN